MLGRVMEESWVEHEHRRSKRVGHTKDSSDALWCHLATGVTRRPRFEQE